MPEPAAELQPPIVRRVARHALLAGIGIMAAKFSIFAVTGSIAILSDAMESIINIVAAAFLMYSLYLSGRPADREHPYGHGKVEFLTVGFEGSMILVAGGIIAYEAISRLIWQSPYLSRLTLGVWLQGAMSLVTLALAIYVYRAGRRYRSAPLVADGKHLATDFVSTLGVFGGLLLVNWTGKHWLDPVVALVMAASILTMSWKLLWQSIQGLMDRIDPADDTLIRGILDDEVAAGVIRSYHKVRHRHSGAFHWVEMHLQVDPTWTIRQGHEVASRIEGRIEQALGQGNATAHIEPCDGGSLVPPPAVA